MAETTWDISSALDAVSVIEHGQVVGYDLACAPAAAQYLGEQLARLARPFGATLIASWPNPDDALLAHIAAVQLGIGRSAVYLDLGLLEISPQPASAQRAVLIGTALSRPLIGQIAGLLPGAGHSVVAAVSLAPFMGSGDVPAGLRTSSLA